MTTDLNRMILAARQIGEVVGEDLLDRLWICLNYGSVSLLDRSNEESFDMTYADALDLLTARVWRAVQKWATESAWSQCKCHGNTIAIDKGEFDAEFPDLPSAVAAIHKHWEENR